MAEPLLLSASVEVLLQKIISITTENINHVFGSSQESSCLNAMMKNLFSHSSEEDNVVQATREELEKLKGSLSTLQAVLRDSQMLQKLGVFAYDADNALAEFGYEILRHDVELQNQTKNKVGLFSSHSNDKVFRREMMPKVSDLRTKLEMINKEVKEFAISEDFKIITASSPHGEISQEIGSLISQSKIVGRENDVSKIVEMLTSPNNQVLSVISIVGIGGIGKTTLAQSIYNDWRTLKKFDRRIWVDVSGDFKINKLLKLILESLTNVIFDSESRADLVKKLKSELGKSRYLLVLDDFWNVKPEIWDKLRKILVDISRTKGNSVLVLSQSVEEASSISTPALHFLEKLSPKNCWSIIKQKNGAGGEQAIGLEDIGMQIAEKCQGLPLVANLLGGLLQNKGKDFWLSVLESGILDTENLVSQILRLSFDYLPSPFLKKCFAFCSMFPRNSVIEREQLVQLWMAEGFVNPQRGSNVIEEEGNLHFDILLQSSLLQATVKDKYNKITQCKMHNLVHDFVSSLSRFDSVNCGGSIQDEIPQIRHLALESFGQKTMKMAQEKAKHLQTLFLKSGVPDNILLHFNYLNVLNLCGADVEKLPESLGRLRYLEYLDLSKTKIRSLPDSLCKLYKLQTLRIIGCKSLQSLPENFKNLLSLRHLHFYYDEFFRMPFGIGQLTHLQTLPIYNVGEKHGPPIGELSRLKDLKGKLEIRNLDLVKDKKEAEQADLFGKHNLQELELRWIEWIREGDLNDENVLAGLRPHPSLKSLRIEYFLGDKFPSWVMKMSVEIDFRGASLRLNNLVELKLERCKRCKEIPTLGLLPHLQYLELHELSNVSCIGPSFYCVNGSNCSSSSEIQVTKALFPALKTFTINKMPELVDWKGAEDISAAYESKVFPRLESLAVTGCPQLTTAPSHFPALKELIVESINSSSPLEKICTAELTTLTNLKIDGVQELICLPGCITALRELVIRNCVSLHEFPTDLDSLKSLEKLDVSCCFRLKLFRTLNGQQGLRFLRSLTIFNCGDLISIPCEVLESCKSLQSLNVIHCYKLVEFSPNFQQIPNISSLDISRCPSLNSMPKGLSALSNLVDLRIDSLSDSMEFETFRTFFTGLHQLSSLHCLFLSGQPHWNSLPEELQDLTAVKEMSLWFFGIEVLPDWIGKLSSLQELDLQFCQDLRSFPSKEIIRGLKKLKKLSVDMCPLLFSAWANQSEPDSEWFKVSHIKKIFSGKDEVSAPGFWDDILEDMEKKKKQTAQQKKKKKKKKKTKKKTNTSTSTS